MTNINTAINNIVSNTCLKFKVRSNEADYVRITNSGGGCWAHVGRIYGAQVVNLGAGCTGTGTVTHELIHALGFYHEQSATNRDQYVRINYENVNTGQGHNFDKYEASLITNFGVGYDYGSIMHYSSHAFSKNGLPTITPLQAGKSIGQRIGMSAMDIAKINAMYNCKAAPVPTIKPPTTTTKATTTTTTKKTTKATTTTTKAPTTKLNLSKL